MAFSRTIVEKSAWLRVTSLLNENSFISQLWVGEEVRFPRSDTKTDSPEVEMSIRHTGLNKRAAKTLASGISGQGFRAVQLIANLRLGRGDDNRVFGFWF